MTPLPETIPRSEIPSLKLVVDRVKSGTLLRVWATPGAKRTRITGVNVWRRALEVDVAAPPKLGRANDELLGYLAPFFHVPAGDLRVSHGATGRAKTIAIPGLDDDQVLLALGEILGHILLAGP